MSRRRLRKVTPYLPMFAGPIERPEPRPEPVAVEPAYPLFRE